ncbi:MAG TPA: peptidoglycan-binding protein, partial [Clostridia bacterium]|nr:peptidoglycan-binding protein [Clostridia bacterium]
IVGPASIAKLYPPTKTPVPEQPKPEQPKPETPKPETPATPITQTLRQGSRGNQVKTLQQKLNELGFNAGGADGIFGSGTRAAVIRFQKANGLAADGIVGPASIAKLYPPTTTPMPEQPKPETPKPETPKPETPKPETPATPITQTLRQGSRGNQVKTLQQKLNELGFNAGGADGIFGSGTRAAVIRFQKANGLAADGIVGPASIAKLYPPAKTPEPEKPKPETPKPDEEKPDPKPEFKEFNGTPGALTGKTIILDAGHGGKDSGATKNGFYEKNFNIDMAKRLERMLKEAGATVVMTRTNDTYSYLFYRSAFVNKYIVDLELAKQETLNEELTADKVKITKELASAEAELATATGEKTKNEGLIDELKGQIDELKGQIATKLGELGVLIESSEYNDLLTELETLEDSCETLQGQIDELDIKIEGILVEIAELPEEPLEGEPTKEDLEGLIRGYNENIAKLEGDKKTSQNELTRIDNAIDSNENEQGDIDELNLELERLLALLSTIQARIDELNDTIIPGLEGSLETLNSEISEVTSQITNLNGKKGQLQNNISNPSHAGRNWIYKPSSTAGNKNIVNNSLKEIFELTKNKYEDNMIFVAVHCNASGNGSGSASGVQVYYRDNRSDGTYGVNSNYYQGYNQAKRLKLANSMLKHTRENTNFKGRWTSPFVKDFHVLREQNLPSVLMEVGFVDNLGDLALLREKQTMEDASKGMYLGIVEYFK